MYFSFSLERTQYLNYGQRPSPLNVSSFLNGKNTRTKIEITDKSCFTVFKIPPESEMV